MEQKLWFKAKRYGWGWYPVSWEGWVIMLAYIAALVKIFIVIDLRSHSVSDLLIAFAPSFIIITGLFLTICYKKGEKPAWHWGK